MHQDFNFRRDTAQFKSSIIFKMESNININSNDKDITIRMTLEEGRKRVRRRMEP